MSDGIHTSRSPHVIKISTTATPKVVRLIRASINWTRFDGPTVRKEEGARLRGSGDGLVGLRGVIDVFVGIDVDHFVFWDWVRWLWGGFRLGVTFGRGLSLCRTSGLYGTR